MRAMTKKVTSVGYTMIELLLVVTVIGVLAGLIVTTYPASQKRARDTIRKSDIKQYQTAMEVYANKNNSLYLTFNGNAESACGSSYLNISGCTKDPKGVSYKLYSTTSLYVVWGVLELPKPSGGSATYFIACSNGKSGEKTESSTPSYNTCPL